MSTSKPIKATARKRGRKAKPYPASWGETIDGLNRRPRGGRWRIIGTDIEYSEPDERLAVHRFKMWKAKKRGELIPVSEKETTLAGVNVAIGEAKKQKITIRIPRDPGKPIVVSRFMPTDEVWPWLRQMILERPGYVAEMTGIESIGWLPELKRPLPSPTLAEVGKLYFDHAKITPNWLAKSKAFWKEFLVVVGVEKLRDIDQEKVVEYADVVNAAAESPSYVRQRFGAVKAIINFPTKRGKWAEDSKRVLAFCSVLVKPSQSSSDPKPVKPEDFQLLLSKADDQMRAILLLALNCCMYASEVARLEWSELDLTKGTLVTSRNKTKIIRVAILWKETIEAVRKLPRKGEALFLTDIGTPADYLSVYRLFKIVRKAAGAEHVQFSQIRDGAYTAAVEGGVDLDTCRLLAGHATGISDAYVKRRPAMVAAACEAIRREYCGN